MSKPQFSHERLQKLMDERGLTDRGLAALTGISAATINALRLGNHKTTSAEKLQKIADALKTTPDYLLGGGNAREGYAPMLLPESVRQMARIAAKLSRERQEELTRIAQVFEDIDRGRGTETKPHDFVSGIEAAMNVVARRYGSEVEAELIAALADNFPELADLLGSPPPAEQKRVNES